MRLNRILIISALLVTLSVIPQGISIYQLVNNGGLDWPMMWENETITWSAIFSLLALLGLFLAFKNKRETPKGSILVILFASIIIVNSVYALVSSGQGPASKGDDKQLQLSKFWGSGWWK